MSVTKAELVRINGRLQDMVRTLLHENRALRADSERLKGALASSTGQLEVLSTRYRRLADYTRKLHEWLRNSDANPK